MSALLRVIVLEIACFKADRMLEHISNLCQERGFAYKRTLVRVRAMLEAPVFKKTKQIKALSNRITR